MDHPTAVSHGLQTPELLCRILGYLSQGELLRVQRVSRTWCSLFQNAPSLCATTFTGASPARDTAATPPRLNTYVINRLRWCPSLDTTLVNSTRFRAVQADQILQAMAYENASWRGQYVTWPPVRKLAVIHGSISQEEPILADLHLTCDRSDAIQFHENEDGGEFDRPTPLVLCVREFPHNQGQECRGITVSDMIYGLRLHYLEPMHTTLQFYLGPMFQDAHGGEIFARFENGERILTVDVTFTTI